MTPGGGGGGNSGGNSAGSSGNSRKRRSGNKGRPAASSGQNQSSGHSRSSAGNRRRTGGADFWGRPAEAVPSDRMIRPTVDPGAVVRSLGDPPLGPNPATAAHHLTAIYEEAVRAATALAAANGLLAEDAL